MADEQVKPIAIVGMSCRLPGDVSTLGDFWKMLCRAKSGWSPVPPERFNAAAYNHPNPDKKGCFNSQGGYFIKQDLSMFDAGFFDMTKKEAEAMDPAQRLLLETTYEALENAGIPKEAVAGKKVGVFVGGNYNEHRMGNLRDLDYTPSFDATGNQGAFLAGRVAYYFNLRGPALTVDTACSSSMHALHLAVQSIRAGESEQAIVAASHLITQPDVWVSMSKLRLFSDAGRTYAFDERAKSGYARGEGAACIVLKPLDQALADNDHVRAVISHSGISHNGRTVGIVAPSPEEQEQLLRDVFAQACIDPRDVGFFEAHGTGTKKGDPIEATAIYRAVASKFRPHEPLFLGSTKPNVGHLECASGLVSVIKAALMLYYGFVLPNAEFEQHNAAIPLERWNMQVPRKQLPWPARRRYACVNNFGFSGSNSTCVLEPAPTARTLEMSGNATYTALRLFVVSANDEAALRASMQQLGIFLEQHAELYQTTMPRNLAYTLCQRRSHLPWRVALVAGMCSGLATALNGADAVPTRAPSAAPRLAFLFTGQGAQWWGMGRELLASHPVFAAAVHKADVTLRAVGADFSIVEELTRDAGSTRVGLAHISQPICSAVQLALVDLLGSFGVRPQSVTGHSSGEIGAAYAAGALTFEGAMQAAYFRGQAIVELKRVHGELRGAMLAVGAGAAELDNLLHAAAVGDEHAVVACENSPSSTTVSGDEAAVDRVAAACRTRGTFQRKLFVDVAYHSHHMQRIADYYLERVRHIGVRQRAQASRVEFYSSLRGRRIALTDLGPQYWVDNLTQAVRFATSLRALVDEARPDVLIEVGPHAALKGPVLQTLQGAGTKTVYVPTLVRDQDAVQTVLQLTGQLFQRGQTLDFFAINHARSEREKPDLIPTLFAYPWTRQRYWYESRISRQHRLKPFARHDLLGGLADWSNDLEPTWRNVLRLEDLPWLRGYLVGGQMELPVAGLVSMAFEAASQRATLRQTDASAYELQDVRVHEPLRIEDGAEVEVLVTMRPTEAAGVDELRICSHEGARGWLDHCRALVQADARRRPSVRELADEHDAASEAASCPSKAPSSASSDAGLEPDTPATEYVGQPGGTDGSDIKTVSGANFYAQLDGIAYPPAFRCVVEYSARPGEASAVCAARDTAADMPMAYETDYVIHPAILDTMMQMPLASLGSAHQAVAIGRVRVSAAWTKAAHESFCARSAAHAKTGAFTVEAFASPGAGAALVSMTGLTYRPIPAAAAAPVAPRELCYKVEWQPLPAAAAPPASDVPELVIVADQAQTPLVAALAAAVADHTGVRPTIASLRALTAFSAPAIVLCDLGRPSLATIAADEFDGLKRLLGQSPGLLWVTRGAVKNATAPEANMALGLVRTCRSEREAVAATLDLDPQSTLDVAAQAALILATFARVLSGAPGDAEMEFAEDDGSLLVPRLAVDAGLNVDVYRELGAAPPYLQDFHQPRRRLELRVPGTDDAALDRLFFADCAKTDLSDGDIEVFVEASAIQADDAGAPSGPLVRPCCGIVTRVGRGVDRLAVGDRVCALASGPFGTYARAPATSAARVPASVNNSVAASIPLAFGAAYHALAGIANVRPGERVLVQLAGPVALAAIEIARHMRADPFVLVSSDAEKAAARKLGFPGQRVLDARSIYLQRHVDDLSAGQRIDVVLTTTGCDSSKAGDCLADFGRFVEVRVSSSHRSSRPTIGDNASFASVYMAGLAVARPEVVARTLEAVLAKFESSALRQSYEPTVFPVRDMAKALRQVRDGAVAPVVVVTGSNDQVKATHHRSDAVFSADGTHIIVGGTGGLGRSMAKFMINNGARTIVLLSRSGGGKDSFDQLLDEIRQPDARILVKKCDVADAAAVDRVIGEIRRELPRITGVVHSAMVLRDGLLESMAHADYLDVIRPKVQGMWSVHNALDETSSPAKRLDYFVMMSSAAGILGSRGQSAYAAANTFLDAFATYRSQNGLRATALDLTAVTGAGYIAENADRAQDILKNFGSETVSEQEVLALLSAAVRGAASSPQILTGLKLRLAAAGADFPYYAQDARFTGLKAAALERAKEEGLDVGPSVSPGDAFRAAATPEEAASVAAQGLLHKMSEVLTINVEDLDAARNITSYGLDSLTAIELRNWIAKELRVNLQILELLSAGTIHDLAAKLVTKSKS